MRPTASARGTSEAHRRFLTVNRYDSRVLFWATTIILVVAIFTPASYGQSETVLWSQDWEGDWTQNWNVDAGTWEVGDPSSGPDSSFAGVDCAATILAGNYPGNVNTRLIRHKSFVVPPASENPRLRFWHWYSIHLCDDYGEVQIRTGSSGDWTTISETYVWPTTCEGWTQAFVDLSAWADSTVQVAFHFYAHEVYSSACNWEGLDVSSGWYIDDVEVVTGPRVFNNPEDWESGLDDWYADFGVWEVGALSSGPDSAYAGDQCLATILDGGYCDGKRSRLISPEFVVPDPDNNPAMRFWHWYSFSSNDYGEVQISVDGGAWEPLPRYTGTGGGIWSPVYIDLATYANQPVRIGFYFHSDGPGTSYGWYIDNVLIDGYPLVPTHLASYHTTTGDSWIELHWRLSEAASGKTKHRITRECVSDGTITEFFLVSGFEHRLSYAFRDDTVSPGETYRYTVAVTDEDGYQILFVTDEVSADPMESALHQNHPNPFNPSTRIPYVVNGTSRVVLTVYDTRGAVVTTLHDGVKSPGRYQAVWDGRNDGGERVASGVYFYRIRVGKFTQTRKMVLLK